VALSKVSLLVVIIRLYEELGVFEFPVYLARLFVVIAGKGIVVEERKLVRLLVGIIKVGD
jgi:hypothetical protein